MFFSMWMEKERHSFNSLPAEDGVSLARSFFILFYFISFNATFNYKKSFLPLIVYDSVILWITFPLVWQSMIGSKDSFIIPTQQQSCSIDSTSSSWCKLSICGTSIGSVCRLETKRILLLAHFLLWLFYPSTQNLWQNLWWSLQQHFTMYH